MKIIFTRPKAGIFDNLNTGIQSDQTNLTVINCTFQNGVGDGIGIDANGGCVFDNGITNCLNDYKIVIKTPGATAKNAFFDMNTAILVKNATMVEVAGCHIVSSQDINNLTGKGGRGIVSENHAFESINIHHNTISNIRNGIWHNGGMDRGTTSFGILNIDDNTITKEIAAIPRATAFIENAINADAFLFGGTSDAIPVNCQRNTIDKCFNGIALSGWRGKNVNISSNTVSMVADAVIAPNSHHFGIKVEGGYGSTHYQSSNPGSVDDNIIQDNQVSGSGMADNNTAIWLSQQSNTKIGCNTVSNAQHGFRFVGINPQTKFWDNTMYTSNKYGLTLWEDGVIDQQGFINTAANNACPSNNSWEQSASYWTSLPNQQFMTYCFKSNATKSPLVIRPSGSSPWINPEGSAFTNQLGIFGMKYSLADGTLIPTTNQEAPDCNRCAGATPYSNRTLLEEIAEGTVLLPADDPDDRLLVMQQQLYELLNANPEQLVNSTSLQQFMLDNQWSNLDFIHYAARYVAEGRYNELQTLLGVWPGHTGLDEAYYSYFDWLLQMHDDPDYQPELPEVWELANRCPLKYGTVVYAVRNLYNALTGEIHGFENNCEDGYQNRGGTKQQGFIRLKQPKQKIDIPIAKQQEKNKLLIYPNPAKGLVNIVFAKIKQVMIIDITGRVVLSQSYDGANNVQLNISHLPVGMFIIKVIGGNNNSTTDKLIVK